MQKKRGWIGNAWEYCIARPLTGRPKKDAMWTMVAEHSELRFIQRNGVFFEDNEGACTACKFGPSNSCASDRTCHA